MQNVGHFAGVYNDYQATVTDFWIKSALSHQHPAYLRATEMSHGPDYIPDNKVHGANMGPTWVLSAPGGHHVGPMDLAIHYQGCCEKYTLPFRHSA